MKLCRIEKTPVGTMQMSGASSDLFDESRYLSLKIYVDWLDSHDLLSGITRPESVPALFYQKNLATENHEIVEDIFRFLAGFNLIEEASGTFVLTSDIEIIKKKTEHIDVNMHKTLPLVKFLEYGLKLVDEKFEGSTGNWDLNKMGYVFERGYSDVLMQYHSFQLDNILHLDRILSHNQHPQIALYAFYPNHFIPALQKILPTHESLTIITPNEHLLNKVKTYCELTDKCSEENIFTTRDVDSEDRFDVLLVPNGVEFYFSFISQLKYFHNHMNEGAHLYVNVPNRPKIQRGIEPLLSLHPNYHKYPNPDEINRFVKANGFAVPTTTGLLNHFYFTTKEGI